ncbi:MAG: hypothetical protein AAFY60_17065, partial [Myxococcota bacterium]
MNRKNSQFLPLGAILSVIAWGCAGSQSGAPDIAFIEPVVIEGSERVLVGPGNTRVEIVELSAPTGVDALLRMSGTKSELDGLILPYRISDQDPKRHYFTTTVDGFDYSYVHLERPNRSPEGEYYKFYSPNNVNESFRLTVDEKQKADVDSLVDDYEDRMRDGSIGKLAMFKRDKEVAHHGEVFAEAVAEMQKSCGAEIRATADWASFSDETLLQRVSWGHYCASPLEGVAKMCGTGPGMKAQLNKAITEVRCTYQDAEGLGLDVEGGILNTKVNRSMTNASERTMDFLR